MIYLSDLYKLISQWSERMDSPVHASDYKIAIAECIYDLDKVIKEELDNQSKQHDAA